MHTSIASELGLAIDADVQQAVGEVIQSYLPTLDRYLEELDKGEFECDCTTAKIKFHPNHRVTATIPVSILEDGYTWAFKIPNIEIEVDGTFEARLS